jgi:uncharacterized protein YcnI
MNSQNRKKSRAIAGSLLALGAGTLLALAPAVSASAHVSASASSTAAGSYSVITFSVPHGCEGSPTLVVEIEIPESILSVIPTVNPNWTIEKVIVPLDEPVEDAHGEDITDRVGSVVYTAVGDGLPDGYRDAFALSLQLPAGEAGDVVEFPTFQTCAEGTAEWVGDEVPSVVLTAAVEDDGHDHGAAPDEGDHGTAEHADASADVLARVFGIAGLAVGAVGIVIAVLSRRSAKV